MLYFRVAQGQQCWYTEKARQQCLYDKQQSLPICNHLHSRWVDSSIKILTSSLQHEMSQESETLHYVSCGENLEFLSHLSLNWYWFVTDRQTDEWTDRIMRASRPVCLALAAVTCKN